MADEKIVIDIEVEKIKADATSLQAQVTELENSLHFGEGLEQPIVSEMLDSYIGSIKSQMGKLFETLQNPDATQQITSGLRASLGSISASIDEVRTSVAELFAVMKSVPTDLSKGFGKDLMDMSRAAQKALQQSTNGLFTGGPQSIDTHRRTLMLDPVFGKAATGMAERFGLSNQARDQMLNAVIRRMMPTMYNKDHMRAAARASGGAMKVMEVLPEIDNFFERLPSRFSKLPLDLSHTPEDELAKDMYICKNGCACRLDKHSSKREKPW